MTSRSVSRTLYWPLDKSTCQGLFNYSLSLCLFGNEILVIKNSEYEGWAKKTLSKN